MLTSDGVTVAIVGEPLAYGVGFLVIVLLGAGGVVGRYPLTMAHEGGHMLAAFASLRSISHYELDDDSGGVTWYEDRRWALSSLVITFAGYATPPLLGLAGAWLIAAGNGWGVLVLGVLLCLATFVKAGNPLAHAMPLLIGGGIVWALLDGTAYLQAGLAVGIVWYLLIAGLARSFTLLTGAGDAADLRHSTVIVPGFVWKLLWIALAAFCLYHGGRLLLTGA